MGGSRLYAPRSGSGGRGGAASPQRCPDCRAGSPALPSELRGTRGVALSQQFKESGDLAAAAAAVTGSPRPFESLSPGASAPIVAPHPGQQAYMLLHYKGFKHMYKKQIMPNRLGMLL